MPTAPKPTAMNTEPSSHGSSQRSPADAGLGVLFLGCLAMTGASLSAAPVQAQCDSIEFQGGNFVCTPADITGDYKTIGAGDLSGDRTLDVAVIKDESLIIYHNAALGNDAVVVSTTAVDLCVARPPCGEADQELCPVELYFTSSNGLERVYFDSEDHAYETEVVDSSTLWQNAKKVRWSMGVGSGTGEGLIGVKSDGHTLIRALRQGVGFASPTTLFDFVLTAMDIALLNYKNFDGDTGTPVEIAILHPNGVGVRKQDGTYVMGRSGYVPGDAITVVRKTGLQVTDSLAWVTRLTSGWSVLMFFHESFTLPQGPLQISQRTFNSLSATDLDADGDDDLVLGAAYWNSLFVQRCDPGAASWYSGPPEQVFMALDGVTSEPADAMGQVLCANYFNDWYADESAMPGFAVALPDSDGLRLMPQLDARHAEFGTAPDFEQVAYSTARHNEECTANPESQSLSLWKLKMGDGWGSIDATHLELIVRKCQSVLTVPDVQLHHFPDEPIDPEGIVMTWLQFEGSDTVLHAEDSPLRYFAAVRPVRLDENGEILKAWRWSILGMSASCAGLEWLLGLPGALPGLIQISPYEACDLEDLECDIATTPLVVTRYVPSAVPQSRIPSPGPGVLPGGPLN